MKKFITKLAIFLVSISLFVYWIGKYDNVYPSASHNVLRLEASKQFDALDYLFIGSSHTHAGINPLLFDKLNKDAFNMGISAASVHFYELILDDYLKSVKTPPKKIIIESSLLTFSPKVDNWEKYPIHRHLSNSISNEKISLKYKTNSNYLILLQRSFVKGLMNIKRLSFNGTINFPASKRIRNNRGFNVMKGVYTESILLSWKNYFDDLKTARFNNKKADEFIELINKLKEKNIEIIVLDFPTFKLKNFFSQRFLEEYGEWINELKANNIRYIKSEMPLKDELYRNVNHLNEQGANLFTAKLIDKLAVIEE